MVTTDVEHELRVQLKEAGKLLSVPPASLDHLLYILDQLEKLLSKVDQSPNSLMQEALSQPMKVLVNESLLEHSNMDVKVSVASCLCEITRITAPEAPYSDDELKRIFQCIVSSFEDLSDKSSRSYTKRVSILETVSKVRSCVIMLDLECDDLIVKLFEHFLSSVRDHHPDNVFSLMSNIMVLVLEESEDISLDILKPLLASVKNDCEGVSPVARKLGEDVIKKSADKLRLYLDKAVTVLGNSLVDYSQVLTSICKGITNFVEHNDESAPVQPNVVNTPQAIGSSDDADKVNTSNEITSTGNKEGKDNKNSSKAEKAVDHSGSSLTSKLDSNEPVAENVVNAESNTDTTTKSAEPIVSETVHGEDRVEKIPKIVVSVKKPLETEVANTRAQSVSQQKESQSDIQIIKGIVSKQLNSEVTNVPSQSGNQQEESQSEKQVKKGIQSKPLESEAPNAPSQSGSQQEESQSEKQTKKGTQSKPSESEVTNAPLQSGSQQEESQSEIQVKKGIRSKKKGAGQTDLPSTVFVITKVSEGKSDPEIKSEKRARKKTAKAEENKASVTSGSDVEPVKKSTKKLDKVDSGKKKTVEAEVNKPLVTSGSDVEPVKKSTKKVDKVDSGSKKKSLDNEGTAVVDVLIKAPESDSVVTSPKRASKRTSKPENSDGVPLKRSTKKAETVESGSASVKGKKAAIAAPVEDKPSITVGSDAEPVDSEPKPTKRSGKKAASGGSVTKKTKLSRKKTPKSKKSKQEDKKTVEAQDSEETNSDNKSLKLSENKEEETDSENKEEETDSDNIPLSLAAKKVKKSSSSVVKAPLKIKDGKKPGRGEDVEEKDQTKSLSDDDDGMDVSLKSALKKASKKKGNSDGALSTSSKRKQRSTQKKVKETVQYDESLVGQKVKVWWPHDKMFYEGIVEEFYSVPKKHKVLYADGDQEVLNLKNEKWEILKESAQNKKDKKDAAEVQTADILPETGGSSKGKSKVESKEDENEERKKDVKKQTPKKIVYSRGKKGSKRKTKSVDDNVKESEAAGETKSQKEKSTEDVSKTGNKRKSESEDDDAEAESEKEKSTEAGSKRKKVK